MVKLKISYENNEELIDFLKMIKANIYKIKKSNNKKGKYKKIYVELKSKEN